MIPATKKDMEPPYLPGDFVSKKKIEVLTSLSSTILRQPRNQTTMVNATTQFDRDSDDNDIWAILILLVAIIYDQDKRNPSNRCITGQGVVDNLLNSGNLTRIHSQLRMNLEAFFRLRNWLQDSSCG
jgi:hypothetical protein